MVQRSMQGKQCQRVCDDMGKERIAVTRSFLPKDSCLRRGFCARRNQQSNWHTTRAVWARPVPGSPMSQARHLQPARSMAGAANAQRLLSASAFSARETTIIRTARERNLHSGLKKALPGKRHFTAAAKPNLDASGPFISPSNLPETSTREFHDRNGCRRLRLILSRRSGHPGS